MIERRKKGRPSIPKEEHQKYQRIAILPNTYKNIKKITKKEKVEIIYWLDEIIERLI